jgi:hypothetical protein
LRPDSVGQKRLTLRLPILAASWATACQAVTVPAGTFQAFKIEYDGRYFAHQSDQSWTGSHKETAWFAPSINRFVKRELEQRAPGRNFLDHHVIELLSFKPAP